MENNHEPIKFYCEGCEEPVCQTCFDTDHKFHSVIPYRDYLHKRLRWYLINGPKKIEAVEAEIQTSLQLASKVIIEYEKKLTELTAWQKKKDQLQEGEAKNRKLMGAWNQVKHFHHNKFYDMDLKNVELCLQEESGNVLMKMVNDSKTAFEEKFGPFFFDVNFVVVSAFDWSQKQICPYQGFDYGHHSFTVRAEMQNGSGITLSMSWQYTGDEKDLEQKTFFFSADIHETAFCKASNKTGGNKKLLTADFCNSYASAHIFRNGRDYDISSSFTFCGSCKVYDLRCKLEFGFNW